MTLSASLYLLVCLCSVGAGFLTASIGFGGAIFTMMFFPHFMPFLQSSAISSVIVYGGILYLAIEYRHHTRWRDIPIPALCYMMCSVPAVFVSRTVNLPVLKMVFAVFIILLGLYNIYGVLSVGTIKLKKNLPTTLVCSILSGLGTGFFGIGGPPIALYFLSVTGDDKAAYTGTLQTFFAICMVASITARFTSGILTMNMMPLALAGLAASFIGKWLGSKTLNRINAKYLKVGVCVFMIVSGVITLMGAL